MKKLASLKLVSVLLFFSVILNPMVLAGEFKTVHSSNLQIGDVLLISLNCMQCRYIESETNSQFSHSGIVLEVHPKIIIGQALGSVHAADLSKFLKPITPNSKVVVVRSREREFNLEFTKLSKNFNEKFLNLGFDGDYLWDNFDQSGKEKIYCSELVHKLLNTILVNKLQPEILSYNKHYDYWFKVFKGNVPQNVWGNSPASFYRNSTAFELLGYLE